MTESSFNLSEIKLYLKRKDLVAKKYKLQNSTNPDDVSQEYLAFLDTVNGTKVSGKIVRSPNERDFWPLLNHKNVAPLFDVLDIRWNLKIYMTIDMQVKLKDIIHKEDFVYTSRCFDRKKTYAKGIFSGLSYIHDKSLCLMNLSDDNIYICNTHDRAIITNFSFISCSRKTTTDKLEVLEHYKPPEASEKYEFNAIAAEVWTSGTLMLDLFLAHMAPWAVIDYNPRRIMEMVNNLSLDLLQAANAGSKVTLTDFTEFKTFLTYFFKDSQSRITAWLASDASFLVVRFEKMFNPNCNCFHQQTEKKYSILAKNPSKSVIPKTDTNPSDFLKNNNSDDSESEEYFDYNGSSVEIFVDVETEDGLKLNPSVSGSLNCTEKEKSFSTGGDTSNLRTQDFNEENEGTIKTEINSKNNTEITCDKQTGFDEKLYIGSENKEDSYSHSKILNKTAKSCQIIKQETNELNFKHHQSKSLSFTNHDGISCESPFKGNCSMNNLCSVFHRTLPVIKSNESDLKSDFCLNNLFENEEWLEKSMTEEKDRREVPNTSNRDLSHNSFEDFITYKPKNQKILQRKYFKEPEIISFTRDSNFTGTDEIPSVEISYSKNDLSSSAKSLQIRQSDELDLKKSDFCLNRLFENKEWSVKSMNEKKASSKVPNTVNTRNLHDSFQDFITYESQNQEISRRNFFKEPEIRLSSRKTSPNSGNKMSIQRIRERLAALRKAEDSLKDHKPLFISEELADKHQSLINQYRDLMRQEKIRLCEVLSNEYKLSLSEVKKLSESVGSKSRYIKKYNRRSIPPKLQYSSSEFSDFKLSDVRERGKIAHRTTIHDRQKLRDSEGGLKLEPRRGLSYYKAMESSANQVRKNWNYGTRKGSERSKLILTEKGAKLLEARNEQNTTNRRGKVPRESRINDCHQLNPSLKDSVLKAKLKDSRELLTTRKEKEKGRKDMKIQLDTKQNKTPTKQSCFFLRSKESLDDLRELILKDKKETKKGQSTLNRKAKDVQEPKSTKNPNCYPLHPSPRDSLLNVKLKDSNELLTTTKLKDRKKLSATKQEKIKSKTDKIPFDTTKKTKTTRRPFFFSLCPGGRVEESFDDLCEACKLELAKK